MPAWMNLNPQIRKKLQVLQNDALRLANRVTRVMRRRIVDMHDEVNLPLIKERLSSSVTKYFIRKAEDPMMLQVKRNLQTPSLRLIGWHRLIHRIIK